MEDLLFNFNEKSSVLLIFFFNASLFSFLLFKASVKEDDQSSKWLGLFLLLGALYLCPFMFGYANWYSVKPYREFLYFVPFQQLFLLGPVFYFYVQSLLNRSFRLNKKNILHLIPATLYFIFSLIVFITDKLILDEFYFYADGQDMDLDFWYQFSGLISMLFYLGLSLRYYRSYRSLSLQEVSFADAIAYKWVRHFIIAFCLILVLRVLFFLINPVWGDFGRKYWYYLCFSILLLYVAITGYSNTIRAIRSREVDLSLNFDLPTVEEEQIVLTESKEEDVLVWREQINGLFDRENVQQKADLTLSDLADLLGTNRSLVSSYINKAFDMNFNDLVNLKRTEALIDRLSNGEHKERTLLSLALDCGFNSKTTFNRAFKKHTGKTPKQYIIDNEW